MNSMKGEISKSFMHVHSAKELWDKIVDREIDMDNRMGPPLSVEEDIVFLDARINECERVLWKAKTTL